tara:strand:- start:339 stop:935 length:597 start_codon:yes stop_codon:yes gene_type:complete
MLFNRRQSYGSSRGHSSNIINNLSFIVLLLLAIGLLYYAYSKWGEDLKGLFKNISKKNEVIDNALEAKVKAACKAAEAKVRAEALEKDRLDTEGTCSDNIQKTRMDCEKMRHCSDTNITNKNECIQKEGANWVPHVWTPLKKVEAEPVENSLVNSSETEPFINATQFEKLDEPFMSYGGSSLIGSDLTEQFMLYNELK